MVYHSIRACIARKAIVRAMNMKIPKYSSPLHCIFYIGGDTIRQLQVQSGCHIELFRGAHPSPNEKLFNIRGVYCTFQFK